MRLFEDFDVFKKRFTLGYYTFVFIIHLRKTGFEKSNLAPLLKMPGSTDSYAVVPLIKHH